MEEIKIEVAEICIMLRSESSEFISSVRRDYSLFLSDRLPSLTLDITLTDEPYVNNSSWAGLSVTGDELRLSDDHLESKINKDLTCGSALISRSGMSMGLGTLLRNMFTFRLILHEDAVVLHAAGILKDDEVYIFMGHSGAGKSTVSALSDDCTILSDDMVIIKRSNGKYQAYTAPHWLDMHIGKRENRGYDIGGIFTLKQDKTTYIKELSLSQALADILTVPHIPNELQPVEKLFDIFSRILVEYGLYEMHFTKDNSFWRHIDGLKQHVS